MEQYSTQILLYALPSALTIARLSFPSKKRCMEIIKPDVLIDI